MVYADANIFLRLILNDNAEMADFAERLLESGEAFILPEVLAEMVYVLNRVYKTKRFEISQKLSLLLDYAETTEKPVMKKALQTYAETALDFVDCILLAHNKVNNAEIATFDKKLRKKLESSG